MKISPVNFIQHNSMQNFKGIKHLTYRDNYDDHTQQVTVDISYYDYYPFQDESKEEIRRNTEPANRTEYINNPYPTYGSHTGEIITLMPALNISKEIYEALRSKNLKDEFIIQTFA